MRLLSGRLEVTRRGRAFLLQEGGDVEVESGRRQGGLHGDTVLVRVLPGGRAEVVEVLERAHAEVVGTVREEAGRLVLVPLEPRLPLFGVEGGANPGDTVVLKVTDYGDETRPPSGRVVEVLGRMGDPGVDVRAIVRKHGLAEAFPAEVMAEAARLPDEVAPSDLEGRLDLRGEEIFTVDSADAKDLDDAISLRLRPEGGFRLGVHIADVSHYAPPGSALDREALRRGTSVYLVDRVLPMFPPALSNHLASLHPSVDRLTLSCFLDFDEKGRRVAFRLTPSVIRSRGRLTYEGVHRFLNGEAGPGADEAAAFGETLHRMRRLKDLLRQNRLRRGAIDFDFPEDKVILDADGRPVEIVRRMRTEADMLIEEFMIAANEAVAEYLAERGLPALFRVHEEPPADKMASLQAFLKLMGIRFRPKEKPRPKDFQAVLRQVAGTEDERIVSLVLLRSMARARYAPENLGHFGLAARFYTHFTSPIRRYPDLVVHRVVKWSLSDQLTAERRHELLTSLPAVADSASERERAAEMAERESVDLKKVAFMADKVGEEYDGFVSGVTPFGFFVEMSVGVEGLVRVADLHDDYYQFHEAAQALVGERTRRRFRLGQPVRVRVTKVDVAAMTVDLALVDEGKPKRRPRAEVRPPAKTSGFDRKKSRDYNVKKRRRA
jgi:ribonuclease R